MANVLVKPQSESDGRLVILADNTREMHLVDVTTGEVIETGRNTGASNGRGATFRFSNPGGSYRNVGLMDDQGNVILTLATAGDRVQFNYNDYDALVQTPVSTIEGYRWNNSRNMAAREQGRPTNAEIANMTPEEYNAYLENERRAAQGSGSSSGGGGAGGVLGSAVVGEAIRQGANTIIRGGAEAAPEILAVRRVAEEAGASVAQAGGTAMEAQQAAQEAVQGAGYGELIGDIATIGAWAYGAYEAYNVLSSDMTDEQKSLELAKRVGLAVADYYTFGLASVAYGVASQSKEFREFEEAMQPYDPVAQSAISLGSIWGGDGDVQDHLNLLSGGMSGVVHNALGINDFSHKSTKEYQAERTADLMGRTEDPFVQESIYRLRNTTPGSSELVSDRHREALEAQWAEHGVDAPSDLTQAIPEQVWGSEGVLATFGPDRWLTEFNEAQRYEITKRMLAEGLFANDKGDIVVPDGNKARAEEIASEVVNDASIVQPDIPQNEFESLRPPELQARMDEAQEEAESSAQPAAETGSRPQGDFSSREELEAAFTPDANPVQGRGGGNGPSTRSLQPSDTDIDPPITGFEHTPGSELSPPGASDNAALAFNLIQNAPSQAIAGQLAGELFNQEERDRRLHFAQLGEAFR